MNHESQASLTVVMSACLSPGTRLLVREGTCYIGRDGDNDIRLEEANVADRHAMIERRDDRYIVESLARGARTTVNYQFVRKWRDLHPGDMLEVGGTTFRFDLVADEASTGTSAAPNKQPAATEPTVLATSRFDLTALRAAAGGNTLRRDFDRVTTAFDAVCNLLNTFDLTALCERMLDAAFKLVAAEHGSVQLRGEDGTLWTAHARSVADDEQTSTAISTTVVEHLLEHKEAVLAMDLGADERFADAASIQASHVRSLMAVPLLASDQVLGILYVVNTSTIGAFHESDLDLMSSIGVGAGLVLSNHHLYQQLETALAQQVAFSDTLKRTVDERTQELRDKNHELHETLVRLEQTQEQIIAQEKLASLGALTAGVAHEMLNPMNFVNNFAELIVERVDELRVRLDGGIRPERWPELRELRELLDDIEGGSRTIHKHGARVHGIINGMRQLSRTTGGEHDRAKLDTVVLTLVNALRNGQPVGGPRLTTRLDPRVGELDLVVSDFSSAVLGILHNALYAVKAKAAQAPSGWSPQVWVETKDLGQTVQLTVRDNGHGIPTHLRTRVFEPFFTTKPTDQGIGLGLSIAHDVIAKMHGGSIAIDSEVGEFTEVRMVVPRSRPVGLLPGRRAGHDSTS